MITLLFVVHLITAQTCIIYDTNSNPEQSYSRVSAVLESKYNNYIKSVDVFDSSALDDTLATVLFPKQIVLPELVAYCN
jgi:hypothetical protein